MMPILSSIANSLGTINGTILSDEQLLVSESKQVSRNGQSSSILIVLQVVFTENF